MKPGLATLYLTTRTYYKGANPGWLDTARILHFAARFSYLFGYTSAGVVSSTMTHTNASQINGFRFEENDCCDGSFVKCKLSFLNSQVQFARMKEYGDKNGLCRINGTSHWCNTHTQIHTPALAGAIVRAKYCDMDKFVYVLILNLSFVTPKGL